MIARPPPPDPTALARAILSAAAEVEAAEAAIKRAILDAARAGDCARIIAIVERWASRPACEVLGGTALDPCSEPEVEVGLTGGDPRRPPTP